MSLINQMLRDLQARQGADQSGAAPPREVVAERSRRLPLPVYLVVFGCCGTLLLWWLAGVMTGGPAPDPRLATQPAAVQLQPQSVVVPAGDLTDREDDKPMPPALLPELAVLPGSSRPAAAAADKTKTVTAARQAGRVLPESLPGAVTNKTVVATGVGGYATAEEGFQAAQGFYRQNRELSAMAALELTLRLDPGHLAARAFLADLYEMAGRFDEAVSLLKQGMAIVPSHLAFKERAAGLLAGQGKIEEAAAVLLHEGLPKVGQAPEIHASLAGYYLQLKEPFLAAQTYRNLLAAWPKVGSFWVGLGSALEAQGLNDDAREAYLQAMAAGDLPDELTRVVAAKLQN